MNRIGNPEFKVDTSDKYVVKLIKPMQSFAKSHICDIIPFFIVESINESNKYELSHITEFIWGSRDSFYNYINRIIDDSTGIIVDFKNFIKNFKENSYKSVKIHSGKIVLKR